MLKVFAVINMVIALLFLLFVNLSASGIILLIFSVLLILSSVGLINFQKIGIKFTFIAGAFGILLSLIMLFFFIRYTVFAKSLSGYRSMRGTHHVTGLKYAFVNLNFFFGIFAGIISLILITYFVIQIIKLRKILKTGLEQDEKPDSDIS